MTTRYVSDQPAAERRVHVIQGEFFVTDDPAIVLTTILGSCVAACLRDPVAGVGGMNHFLVPDDDKAVAGPDALRYGVHSMELLVNGLLRLGAQRDRLEAKLFGGARMVDGLSDIGSKNAVFAEQFLSREGIALSGSSLRGNNARRLQFWPVSGRVRQMIVAKDVETVFVAERQKKVPALPAAGALELF